MGAGVPILVTAVCLLILNSKHVVLPSLSQSIPVCPSLLEEINTQLSVGASVSPHQCSVTVSVSLVIMGSRLQYILDIWQISDDLTRTVRCDDGNNGYIVFFY